MFHAESYNLLWHDADPTGLVRPSALLRYMQETANRQCRGWGYDLDRMFRNDGQGFLLARLQLTAYTALHPYDDIEVRTWCPLSHGYTFLRCFRVMRGNEIAAEALTTWALMDVRRHALLKVTDFYGEFPTDEPLETDYLPGKVRLSPAVQMEAAGERKVAWSDIDFNRHMNNTRYPDVICDFLPAEAIEGRELASLSISYKKEAPLGDVLQISRARMQDSENGYLVKATRGDGEVCFEAQILYR
jgi:medium-chain acyl-[acyl-carrier-protein] hydrolase